MKRSPMQYRSLKRRSPKRRSPTRSSGKRWSRKHRGGGQVRTVHGETIDLTGRVDKESALLRDQRNDVRSDAPIPLGFRDNDNASLHFLNRRILEIIDSDQPLADFDLDTLCDLAKAADFLDMESYLDQVTTEIAQRFRERYL